MALVAVLVGLAATGCAGADPGPDSGSAGPTTLSLWRHAGTDGENRVFAAQVRDFNAAHSSIKVEVRTVPEGDYNDALQAAAAGQRLPDVAEIDGPLVSSYVYQQQLRPLDSLLPPETLDAQLPSLKAQGTVGRHVYAAGVFDSGLGLYADRRQLRAAGITSWPTSPAEAWTAREFRGALAKLAAHDRDGHVLDVKLSYGVGEWLSYGFSPLVASAGGELIDPSTLSPGDHLDGPATNLALRTLASWSRYVDPNPEDDAFGRRRVALSWVGHWVYPDYAKALGSDLVVLPLPDLGQGAKSGQGSWAWSVSAGSSHADAAATFLRYLLERDQILRMTNANGAVPGSEEALASSALYGPKGPLRLFAEQLLASCGRTAPTSTCVAVPRPATPAYPMLSAQFSKAVSLALTGGDWAKALRVGTDRVQQDLETNRGYR